MALVLSSGVLVATIEMQPLGDVWSVINHVAHVRGHHLMNAMNAPLATS